MIPLYKHKIKIKFFLIILCILLIIILIESIYLFPRIRQNINKSISNIQNETRFQSEVNSEQSLKMIKENIIQKTINSVKLFTLLVIIALILSITILINILKNELIPLKKILDNIKSGNDIKYVPGFSISCSQR